MFDNQTDLPEDKGLFTFYRQQAEIEQKFATNKKKLHHHNQSLTFKKNSKLNSSHHDIGISQSNQHDPYSTQKFIPKKSFPELNKNFIRRLSLRNENTLDATKGQFGSEVVVIKKKKLQKQKEQTKLNKFNSRYHMQDGHYLKQKIFDPLQQGLLHWNESPQKSQASIEESLMRRKMMKRNQSFNDRQIPSKSKLESELIMHKEIKTSRQNVTAQMFQGLKKVEMHPQFQTQDRRNCSNLTHKRIPPKVLASMLRSQNNEIIKHLRMELQKQKQQIKNQTPHRNHSYIEYGSYDYQRSGLDLGKLNEKQRRLITILNKFHKTPQTKVFID